MKLEVKNLTVEIKNKTILHNVSLSVKDGEFMALLGPSGCGKSTLLKTIAGILPLKEGTLYLNGNDITMTPAHRRNTVIVFQDMRLFPNMTVAENVAFPLKMQGANKKDRLESASSFLEKVKLGGFDNRKIYELSGGQQQRVALARALASRPDMLFLDEPFSSLDENLRGEMRELVLTIHKEFNMTTIMVTHDREEAFQMSDRVAIMFKGDIHQLNTPDVVRANPATPQVEEYLGNYIKR